ncbi:MAG: hypothetical protein DCC43_00080 [Candidatus Brocadia sp.]|uniref:Flagellar assembly protein FliH n=1 Tax=Candidatus Brocadia fulgida TaxID=380242 RepID=A0A0M2URL4_9BACT|nr:MAG: Yop protein translocation protein L [Candidatus Brocadia fulgida]MCC6324920.1 hypothetical protein [Candidatus Brocadia sp.]MCE7911256.1 hypothetical protein [Candidatus Brocadia sp. AMX3]MBV6517552.1 hypothetical protein [Candidatus Brocadia fulgida]MDG5996199.1 hypothetical protein [Candidatus Brocadia sp.]
MKSKKVYISPAVKGVHILQSVEHQSNPSPKDYELKEDCEKEKEKDNEKMIAEFKAREDEAYRNGKLDAEKGFQRELEEIKNNNASLITMLHDAVKHFVERREKLWEECEPEIMNLVLAIAGKAVGYEIKNDSMNVTQQVMKDALTYAKEKKIIVIRLSCDDVKKMNESEEIKIAEQSIKFIEDKTISPGGCVIETDFGSIDSRIETRWEEIIKALSENKNDKTAHSF